MEGEYRNFTEMKPFEGVLPSKRTLLGVEEAMSQYLNIANNLAKIKRENPNKYRIKEIYLVGSAVSNKEDSDLDFVFVPSKVSEVDRDKLKIDLAKKLFCNKEKREALDIFIGDVDLSRPSFNLTPYVKQILNTYNPISSNRN